MNKLSVSSFLRRLQEIFEPEDIFNSFMVGPSSFGVIGRYVKVEDVISLIEKYLGTRLSLVPTDGSVKFEGIELFFKKGTPYLYRPRDDFLVLLVEAENEEILYEVRCDKSCNKELAKALALFPRVYDKDSYKDLFVLRRKKSATTLFIVRNWERSFERSFSTINRLNYKFVYDLTPFLNFGLFLSDEERGVFIDRNSFTLYFVNNDVIEAFEGFLRNLFFDDKLVDLNDEIYLQYLRIDKNKLTVRFVTEDRRITSEEILFKIDKNGVELNHFQLFNSYDSFKFKKDRIIRTRNASAISLTTVVNNTVVVSSYSTIMELQNDEVVVTSYPEVFLL